MTKEQIRQKLLNGLTSEQLAAEGCERFVEGEVRGFMILAGGGYVGLDYFNTLFEGDLSAFWFCFDDNIKEFQEAYL